MTNVSFAAEPQILYSEAVGNAVIEPLADDHLPLLVREMNHRLFNTLQVVMTLVHVAQRTSSGDARTRENAFEDVNVRLSAFARLHRLLADPDPWPLEDHCRQLCVQLIRAFGREGVTPWVSMIDAPLTSNQRIRLAMLVAELVTNSLKHGLARAEEGVIWIDLTSFAPDGLELAVRDTAALTEAPARRPAIVDALAKSLAGDAHIILRGGYSTVVRFPRLAGCALTPRGVHI